ncbi:uncharacterized protein LOC121736335 [Aricia agestis]|uniref:uncharacterized protein LOC121736335 n=1 Tax=Aricia agestis TaxID=91739 RepID=UPI001C20823E|nr:uncharacterized protein LOC121736335 [Aricia agestis]
MTDRCTKWLKAIPVQEITAEVVAKAFYDNWIARFGVPLRITTDQGRQFESSLFRTLLQKFGITRIRTTAFHPQSNGQIERWHRTMKTALVARGASTQWADELPTVLLGLRTALREDTKVSPALMTYGTTLRVPSDFFVPSTSKNEDAEFVRKLTETMATLKPHQRSCEKRSTFIHKDLYTCSHVFVRNDTVRAPLTPPYDGPYEVLKRNEKYFKIQLPLRTTVVSLDRLKPAYLLNQEACESENTSSTPSPPQPSQPSQPTQPQVRVTRSGRISKPTVRFT